MEKNVPEKAPEQDPIEETLPVKKLEQLTDAINPTSVPIIPFSWAYVDREAGPSRGIDIHQGSGAGSHNVAAGSSKSDSQALPPVGNSGGASVTQQQPVQGGQSQTIPHHPPGGPPVFGGSGSSGGPTLSSLGPTSEDGANPSELNNGSEEPGPGSKYE